MQSPNWQEARVFLDRIAGRPDPVMTFQVFDDKAENYTLAAWKHGKLSDPKVRSWITRKADQGCGVYVVVSACDGGGRRRQNVKYARATFIDLDGEPLPDVWDIEPDIINETSPGKFHCFWLTNKETDLNFFSDTQARFAARFSADPRVFDPPRVVRLPGCYHQKGKPYRSKTIKLSDRDPQFDRFDMHELAELTPADYTPPSARAEGGRSEEPEAGWDSPADEERARLYLAAVKVPTSGDRNNQGYRVAARLNDLGISPELSEELMTEIWNERLSEPLKDHEIQHVINSAGRYKASSAGSSSAGNGPTAEEEFADDVDNIEEFRVFDFEGTPEDTSKADQRIEKVDEFDFDHGDKPNFEGDGTPEGVLRPAKTIRRNVNGLSYSFANEVRAEALEWLWPDRVPRGKVTIIAGFPDQGKSQIMLKIAAIVSTGGDWPNDEGSCPEGVAIILSSEDDEADTLIPRLAAAGANLANVITIRSMVKEVVDGKKTRRVLNIEDDLAKINIIIKDLASKGRYVRFIGFDPINAYFGGPRKGDSHKTADMRALLTPLAEWAGRLKIAICAISHFNKGSNNHTLYRITDSSAITAAARSVYVAVRENSDKPDEAPKRIFVPIKHNLAKDAIKGIEYDIDARDVSALTGVEGQSMPYIEFGAGTDTTADEALGGGLKAGPKTDARDTAITTIGTWFKDTDLAPKGIMPAKTLWKLCEQSGISRNTAIRALMVMGGESKPSKGKFQGGAEWTLPDPADDFEGDPGNDEDVPIMDRNFG